MNRSKLDLMFGGMDDDEAEGENASDVELNNQSSGSPSKSDQNKKKKKKKNKKNKNKRQAEENVQQLEKELVVDTSSHQKRVKPTADNQGVGGYNEDEEMKLQREGELLDQLINMDAINQSGYKEEDYIVERQEWANCIHEYCAPKGFIRPEYKRPQVRAKEYKFKLDKFQEKAVECIERNESVLVAAHTSAGKTAIAEYSIALALKNKQRVIYTSPIKALSNQKYRELQEEFQDVGLMTGDVTINESASCIVMTTEILRSMLYNGSEITREMAWVIFDEVHYMRDKERGVVWEETIILLSTVVKYVFLSATIPNAREFAEWIVKIKQQPCNVVYTDYRPTPLQHYIYPNGGEGIHLVVDEKGVFKEQNFAKAIAVLEGDLNLDKLLDEKKKKQQKTTQSQEIKKIVSLIVDKGLDPCIIFSFSKRDCEQYAMALKGCDFNEQNEKDSIKVVYSNAISSLAEEDQQLPSIQLMLPLLMRGIGIHHGGLLPIVKEVIELLFQEGLLKILFTTETFSMGINMPAKTVVFTSIEKFDGDEYRWISGGEYIQMSGRAGRRGLDDKGITILIANKKLEPEIAKSILKGKSDPLYSSFHLGYNMLLNMMRIEDIHPEDIILKSFHQFQNERALPQMKGKLNELLAEYQSLQIPNEEVLMKKRKFEEQMSKIEKEVNKIITVPENIVPFLCPGRLLKIKSEDVDWGWGVLVAFSKQKINPKKFLSTQNKSKEYIDILTQQETHYILDVILYCKNRLTTDNVLQPGNFALQDGRLGIVPVVLHHSSVAAISSIQMNLPHNLKQQENFKAIEIMYTELMKRFEQGNKLPVLDPVEDMEIQSRDLDKLLQAKDQIKQELNKMTAVTTISEIHMSMYERKEQLKDEIKDLEDGVRKASEMIMKQDLVNMKRVMRRLDMCDKNDVPSLKGKVACRISAADELLTTELLFSGIFQNLDSHQIAALCSCLVYTDSKGEGKLTKEEKLAGPYGKLQETADRVATIMIESKIPLEREEYIKSFSPELMELVYKWCQGAKFKEICEMGQEIYEGTIIRGFRRLDELLQQMTDCVKIIGNTELKQKFEDAQKNLKRGIIFTASLYL